MFGFTPTAPFTPVDVQLRFGCGNPVTSVCTNPTVPSAAPVSITIAPNATPTFAVFVTGTDVITLDPAGKRIFVRFRDVGDITRGSTSVAVQTDVVAPSISPPPGIY